MSTLPSHPNLSPQWKLEVNRRVAAHLNRKAPSADLTTGLTAGPETATEARPTPDSRAAQAVARVAARYANAPSYSEMLASEARAAVAAAEVAARAALEAQAAAQSVLDSIEAAASAELAAQDEPSGAAPELVAGEMHGARGGEPASAPDAAAPNRFGEQFSDRFAAPAGRPAFELAPEPVRMEAVRPAPLPDGQGFAIRWEPDLPALRREPEAARTSPVPEAFDFGAPGWPGTEAGGYSGGEIGVVEPAQPIYANLIQFPRELVAARKVRPRLAEGPLAAEPGAQLSIFEVDPGAVSTEPEPAGAAAQAAAAPLWAPPDRRGPDWTGPDWAKPDWSGIRLDAEPAPEHDREPELQQPPPETALELAPLSRRLLSLVFDAALIGAALVTAAVVAATKTAQPPALRTVEAGSAVALVLVAALYHVLFFTLARATPGMRFAGIQLCTFDRQMPTRAQRTARLAALLLSVLPVGLGLAWALFDEDRLTWHDRLSRTYLRRN